MHRIQTTLANCWFLSKHIQFWETEANEKIRTRTQRKDLYNDNFVNFANWSN